MSKPLILFQNFENTAVISFYTSIGFEFVKGTT